MNHLSNVRQIDNNNNNKHTLKSRNVNNNDSFDLSNLLLNSNCKGTIVSGYS